MAEGRFFTRLYPWWTRYSFVACQESHDPLGQERSRSSLHHIFPPRGIGLVIEWFHNILVDQGQAHTDRQPSPKGLTPALGDPRPPSEQVSSRSGRDFL